MTNNDQTRTALLVIDVQQGMFNKRIPIYNGEGMLANINTLVEQAHAAGAPVIYVQHSDERALVKGSPDWQLHPALQPQEPDAIIHKRHGNAFEKTELEELLKSKDVNRVVVAGLVTHGCVKNTCQGARQLGYRVVLVKDGHSSFSADAEKLINEWNAKLAEIGCEVEQAEKIEFDHR